MVKGKQCKKAMKYSKSARTHTQTKGEPVDVLLNEYRIMKMTLLFWLL